MGNRPVFAECKKSTHPPFTKGGQKGIWGDGFFRTPQMMLTYLSRSL